MIPDQKASDQIPVTLRRAVEAILSQWEAAARGGPRWTRWKRRWAPPCGRSPRRW